MQTDQFFTNCLYVSDLIEHASIFLEIGSNDVLISAGGDDMYPIGFSCELLTFYGF